MIWTNRDAKICGVIILGIVAIAALFALVVGGCTPEPTGEPTPTPTSETSPISPLPEPTLYDLVPVPAVTYEPHPRIQTTDIVTFSMDLLCDVVIEIDPEETSPEQFMAALSYTLVTMSRVKLDGVVIAQSEFDTGIGPYLGDGPCVGKFVTLHFHVDRMLYDYPRLYTFWANGCWYPPAGYDLPVACFEPGPDEIVDGAGYSYMGNFRGRMGEINIYLPQLNKNSVSNVE